MECSIYLRARPKFGAKGLCWCGRSCRRLREHGTVINNNIEVTGTTHAPDYYF